MEPKPNLIGDQAMFISMAHTMNKVSEAFTVASSASISAAAAAAHAEHATSGADPSYYRRMEAIENNIDFNDEHLQTLREEFGDLNRKFDGLVDMDDLQVVKNDVKDLQCEMCDLAADVENLQNVASSSQGLQMTSIHTPLDEPIGDPSNDAAGVPVRMEFQGKHRMRYMNGDMRVQRFVTCCQVIRATHVVNYEVVQLDMAPLMSMTIKELLRMRHNNLEFVQDPNHV